MKVLVTGSTGQLGQAVCAELAARGITCVPAAHGDLELTDRGAVFGFVAEAAPDAVIHCAAYTNVDKAEYAPERCMAVNALGTGYLAQAASEAGAKMILVSTDEVSASEALSCAQAGCFRRRATISSGRSFASAVKTAASRWSATRSARRLMLRTWPPISAGWS